MVTDSQQWVALLAMPTVRSCLWHEPHVRLSGLSVCLSSASASSFLAHVLWLNRT